MKQIPKWFAACFMALILLLCFAWFLPAQVTQISGLAVAQSNTKWNRLKDMAQGDGQTSGIAFYSPCLWNGASCDRQRGSIASGAEVNVRAFSGSSTPADTFANPTTAIVSYSLGGLFNGTTWDRWRSANVFGDGGTGFGAGLVASSIFNGTTFDRESSISASKLTATTSVGTALTVPLSTWSITSTPAVATQATASRASGGGTVRHVATAVSGCLATGATAQTPILMHLRDGAAGAGTIIRSWAFSAPVNSTSCVNLSGLAMIGTAATAMTIEFTGAGVAASQQTVALSGFSVP
jgi:hypothetical protein